MTKKKYAAIAAALLVLTGCSSTPTVEPPAQEVVEEPPAAETPVEEVGEETQTDLGTTRENPAPIGHVIKDGEWEVTINSVNTDATADLLAHNEFNDPPADGNVYILVNATVKYLGDNPQGEMPWTTINYVTADGNTIDQAWVDTPTDFTLLDPLYKDASHTGDTAFEVPESVDGVLAVSPDMTSDKVFVAIQ